ncbi:hypothetical protein Y032_0084g1756 [Ancylostoma ceylanicum]|uniref:Uncharacterized protein n=1 Tax=Ancylostoma ceylanicum TaxID=53326 RepID=A0A016TR20_9BILA|nr:hypothetical protein Y032_0084g1756 [Ancylostoma ceylanicum]
MPTEEWYSNFVDIDGVDVSTIDDHEVVDIRSVIHWCHKCGIAYRAEDTLTACVLAYTKDEELYHCSASILLMTSRKFIAGFTIIRGSCE